MKTTRILSLAMTMAMGMIAGLQASVTEHLPPAPLPDFKTPEQLAKWRSDIAARTANRESTSSRPSTLDSSTPFYTGKPYLAESGSYAFKYREYNPEMGRWTTVDPSGFPDGANNRMYASVPTSQLDNNGLKNMPILDRYVTTWITTVDQGIESSDVIGMISSLTDKSKMTSLTLSVLDPYIKSLLFDNIQKSTTCTNIYSEDIASENPKLVSGFPKTGQSPNFTFFDTAITTTLTKFTLIFSTITEYRWE